MMSNRKPLILVTNDDGYQAKGIVSLTSAMKGLGEIVVLHPIHPPARACRVLSLLQHRFVQEYFTKKRILQHTCVTERRQTV